MLPRSFHVLWLLFSLPSLKEWSSQLQRCRRSGLPLDAKRKSSKTGFVSCCSPSPLSDQGWAVRWGPLNTYSTRWTRGTRAEQRQCQTCTSAESRRRRRRTEIRSRSPATPRGAAGGATAQWVSPYCCDAPPTSCCSETVPRRRSSCQPTRVLAQTCKQCPLRTCMPKHFKIGLVMME